MRWLWWAVLVGSLVGLWLSRPTQPWHWSEGIVEERELPLVTE